MVNKFIERLSRVLSDRDMRQADLAKISGIRASSISDWMSGKYFPKQDKIDAIAKALSVSPAWLMGYGEDTEAKEKNKEIPSSYSYIHIPVGISAGQLENCDGLTELPRVSIPDFYLGKYARDPRIVIMHVNGESMNRVIENGATIAVMTGIQQDYLSDGDIVVACVGPSYTVKRFYNVREKESIVLSPDSTDPTFVPIIVSYDSPDSIRIFGKVVMYSVLL